MHIIMLFIIGCISGFVLFARVCLVNDGVSVKGKYRVSVIIPARNEEKNLPLLLESLKKQTYQPEEVIVVDDFSSDETGKIGRQYGVKVIQNSQLPEGWTGKNWALWNGFLNSSGDVLVFLDADVRLAPHALEALIKTRERCDGAISVVPYHRPERFYEKLSLIPYLLGVFAFTSPFERKSSIKSLYGSCIVVAREDYEKINGHYGVRHEIMDDMTLGKRFSEAGINVENFIGYDLVSFRMYPNGIKNEIEGFSKSAVLGMVNLSRSTVALIALWFIGIFLSGFMVPFLLATRHPWLWPFLLGYIMYTLQIIYLLKYTGAYGKILPVVHFLSLAFFILIMIYSMYQVMFKGCVYWKGRQIEIKTRRGL